MKTHIAIGVVVLLSVSSAVCRAGAGEGSLATVVNYRKFVCDAVDGKLGTNKLDSFTVSMMVAQTLDKNEACLSYLRDAPKRCFDALPSTPYRASASLLNWDEATVTSLRIGPKGGSVALRVKSHDGKDEFLIRTMGGAKQRLACIENLTHKYSSSKPPTEQIANLEWALSPVDVSAAVGLSTNLLMQLISDRQYQPVDLRPPVIYAGPKVWVKRGEANEMVRANAQTVRYPYWSAEFADANKTHIARFVFSRNGTNENWVPIEIGLDGYPWADEERPLIELADAFLEPGWELNIHSSFVSLTAEGASSVMNEAMSQIQISPK